MRDLVKIAFVISHACPLKCDFCCSTKEVVGAKRLSRNMMESIMVAFSREPSVVSFGFTGGDPFLFIDDIRSALQGARAAGVCQPFQMTTSSYWAKDPTEVDKLLSDLVELGLSGLTLSFDHEHARWVTANQVRMVAAAASAHNIEVLISGTFWDPNDKVETLLPDLAKRLPMVNHPVAPMGRALKSATWPRRYNVPTIDKLSCGAAGMYTCAVYPDGEVYPCCAGGLQIEGKLSAGNINHDRPAHILYAATTNFHVRLAKEFGWDVLYTLVAREAPDLVPLLPRFDDADTVCELCRDINLTLRDRLAPVYELIEREYARARAEREWQRPPSPAVRRIAGADMVLSDFLVRLDTDRAARLDYLAGVLEIVSDVDRPAPSAAGERWR